MKSVPRLVFLLGLLLVVFSQEPVSTPETSPPTSSVTVQVEPDAVHRIETHEPQNSPPNQDQNQGEINAQSSNIVIEPKDPEKEESSPSPQSDSASPPQQSIKSQLKVQSQAAQAQTVQPIVVPPTPEAVPQQITVQSESIDLISDAGSPSISLQNLTEEQKKKMLEEEAILSAYHKDPDGDFSMYANMTTKELADMQKRMHEEARNAYESAMKQMEERDRRASEEIDRLMRQQKLSNTQTISHQENKQFRERKEMFNPRTYEPGRDAYYRHQFNEYMFEIEKGEMQDFSIQIPIAQKVALYLHTYTNKNGIYSLADDVDENPAMLQVYENNNMKIISETFFFKKYVIFQGKDHFTYSIKILNPGLSRLFSLNVVHLLESVHISHTIEADVMIGHGTRTSSLYEQLQQRIQQTQKKKIMQISNQNRLSSGIRHYYIYSIAQIVAILAACVIQVKMIERLLGSKSVV